MKNKKVILLITVLLLLFTLIGCNAKSEDRAPSISGGDSGDTGGIIVDNVSERKIIYYVDTYLVVNDILSSSDSILSKLQEGEYAEKKSISSDYASLVLRIKTDRLDEFLDSLSTDGNIISTNVSSEDISNRYYDRKLKIDTLNIARVRYEELLKDATSQDVILILEKISEIDYELQKLTNEQNTDNNLIDYSVVNISLRKENNYGKVSFGDKIKNSFTQGFEIFGEFLGGVFLFIIGVLPFIIILAVIIVLIILIRKRNKKKKQ